MTLDTNHQGNANQPTRYHLTSLRMAIIKKTKDNSEDVEKKEPLCTVGGTVNCAATIENNI